MVLTYSTMLPLGTKAPDFNLPDVVSGKNISLASFTGKKGLLVMFICKHCPYVEHIKTELTRLGNDYAGKEIGIIAISSNDASTHPDDGPEHLKTFAVQNKFSFPLCYDETQEVAKAYTAACTPDFFLFDSEQHLVYRGQLDDSRPGNNTPLSGADLRKAMDTVLAEQTVSTEQKPSVGCNIKWKAGKAPSYFAS